MVIDYQAILAVLTIVCGIFLAGRAFGSLENKLVQKAKDEDDCKQQLNLLHSKFDTHLLSELARKSDPE